MSDPRDQRQRHRVRDVGADDARHRQLRVKQQQRGHAHRAGADRRNRDQHAERCADQHGRAGGACRRRAAPCASDSDCMMALRKISDAAVSNSAKAEHHVDQAARGVAVEIELPQHDQRQDAGRDAAAGEPDHRRPVDAARPAVHHAAAGLGGGGVEQIGADRRRRDECRTAGSAAASSASRRRRRSCRPEGRRRNPKRRRADQSPASSGPALTVGHRKSSLAGPAADVVLTR